MNAPTPYDGAPRAEALPRAIGLHGRTAVLSAMAGGVALGGVLVANLTLEGRLSGHALFMNATALFVVGAALGLVHGLVLGFVGRPAGVPARRALGDLPRAGLYAVPGLAVSWLASVWVAMSLIAAYTGKTAALVGVALGWLAVAAILVAAAVHGLRALVNAYARWPERRAGTVLVAATFAALLVIFLADRPELWGQRIRLTETGAVLLAAVLTVWVAGPLVTVALRLARRIPSPVPGAGVVGVRWRAADALLGLTAGAVVGLVALPFVVPSVGAVGAGAVVTSVAQAVLDEVLLRLFLVTAVAWLLLRWHRVRADDAAIGAVAAAAVVQVALYTPGALAVGFASWVGLAAFLLAAVALPAVVFGVLYWQRGFPTALLADATALLALALI